MECEIKYNAIYISIQNIDYLGMFLTKYVQGLYEENHKTLMN